MEGIAEADEMYVLESHKGARKPGRPPRQRGGKATPRGIPNEQMCILVARDRSGQVIDAVTGKGALPAALLRLALGAGWAARPGRRCIPPDGDGQLPHSM